MSLMSLKSAAPPLVKSGKQEYYPVSLQQQGVYLQSMIDPDNTVWNTSHSWRYQGPFHLEAFNKAVLQLVQRQAALRTNFHLKKDKIFQQVNEPGETTDPFFTFTDISTYPQREQMDMAKSIEDEEANQSYNLTESPLVRFHVVRFTHNDHLIIISKHHIISDVTSRQLLRRELIELYNANVTGEPHNLEPLGIQYYDYAVWQQDFFESSYYDAQRKYWLNELSGTLPVLNVPLDFSRKENRRLKSATSEILLDTEMVPAIRTFALRNRVPFSSIFLLAFYILLSKHSGQEDIVVGTLYRGRNFDKKNMGKIIGLFVNRIAVRLNLGSDDDHDHSLRDLLTKVDKKTREAFKNQDFLFEELIRAIHPERTEDHAPVFQVVFNMIKVPTIKTEFHGLTQSQWQGTELDSNIASQYDLTIYVRDDLENIGIKLLYSQNLFLRSTIRRLLDQYNGILNTLINRKEETFSQLEIITEEERHRLLEEFNATAVDYPAEKSIHQLFKEQAERTPEQTAVLQDGSLTYKELDNKSDQLALLLREKGVEPGANPIVALMMERTPDMMTAIFGVLKAGAAYLPIDPQFPQERIDFMLKDSGASIIVGNDLIVKRLNGSSAVIGKPANHAYVIYTSGSTGIPKGVVLGHRAVHNFFIGMSEIIDFSAGKTILALTTISFDIFVLETLLPLCRGLKVVLANETHQKDLKSLEALIIDEEVEMMQATPTRMQLFTVNREKESALRNLKELMVGGEALPLKLLEDLKQMTSARIYNMYGPTETTVWSAVKELTKAQTITIGGPIANTQLYILNKNNNLQPIGVVGDLWIGGDGLAEGYLNRPKLTSEVFVNNKYKTGDMARWLSDGTIEFLGRIDHQVKIRGFRIELGEIEAALNKYPGISESAVVAVENSTGGKSLCAYAVTLENKELDIPKLREYLGEKLTEYMIPSYFMRMDQFPLTHNNKIDRKALPAPAIEGMPRSEVDYEAPGDDVQQKLADVWQEVLGVEQVGIHDQFFVLGGDSIKAIQAAAKLSVFGYELDISLLFKYPTIQKLSQHIKIKQPPEAARTGKRKEEDAPDHAEMERIYHSADPKNISKIYNLSPMQEGMLYHYMVDSEGLNRTAYAVQIFYHLEGDIDTELFRRSYERLIEKYDVFRTAIIYKDLKQPKQVVLTKRDAEFAFHDLTLPNGSGLEEIKADDRHRGFDLLKDLLLRFTLVKTNPQNYMLMITFHHIIMDGWSTNLLLKDFIAIYHEFKNNRQPDASLPYSYSSYIQCLEDQDTGAAETYWRDYMNQFNQVTRILPIHHGVSTGNPVEFKKRNYTMELDDDTGAGLMQMARREETTLNNVIQAVWAMILNRYCGSEDVVFGTVISGRNFPLEGIDQMIGLFINTIPLRVSIHEDRQFGQLLGAIKNHLIESQRYGYLPLAEVQRHAAVEGQLLEHLYIYENFPVDQGVRSARLIDTVGFKITGRSTEEQTNYHLNLVIIPRKKIILRLQYNENVYGSSFITVLGNHIRHIIRQIINQPDLTLSDIQLVTGEEKKQLIETFNATEREFPHDKTIHQLFEEQVLKSPDHIALEMESRCLTYDELNKQSNRLARFLQQNGVKHGSIVGIILTRSLQLVTFVFAILKTGGTFLNLDPEYPKDRLDFMINDTGLQVLLVGENIHEKETRPHLNFKPLTIDPGTHDHAHAIASQDNTNITNTSSPGDPAYIIYTSGSTGIPKGVLGLHKGMVNRFNWMWTTYPFKANDVCCQKTSMNFVDCLWETFGPLLKGLPLVIIPKNVIIDLPAFVHILETRQVTRIVLVPGLLYWFFDDNTGYYKKLPHLTLWVSSGETLQPGFPALFREAAPQSTLLNIYGSSEISADVTCYNTTDTPGGREDGLLTVPIGRPIDNTQIYILNEARSPVPIGIAGEIYAGGVGLAAGYLNQPELTMERFNHDFKDFKDDRDIKKEKIEPTSSYEVNLYRTGDLARWLEDGNIEYLGRKDRQVKIRGFRIEIGEIEGQLRVHPGIKEAVVIDRKNKGSQDLCAYFVPLEEEILTVDLLKEYLKNKLPDYMIPSYFVPIETIPLTSTNKVNRKALPEPGQGLATGAVYEAPGTPVEEKLVSIWQEILNVDRIGINDDFFNLGGHSIKVIRLTGYIKRDFNVDFSLQAVFKHTTIKAQARFISSSEHSRYNPIEAAGTRDHYPVSPVQKRMYLIQQLDPASSAYNIYRSYVVKGAFDRDRLVTAINRMVSRHDVLRTSFEMVKGEPMQRINEADTLGLIIDYAEEVFQGPSTAQYTGLIESFIRPYNLSRAPLFRVKLSRLHPDEYLLVIDMHHIITDFASMEILIRDLMQAYQHDGADETQEPANSIQYRDYTVWQQEVITENRLKEQETFWLERFSGNIPALDFPTDYPRPQIQSDAGDRFNIDADKELTLKLNLLARGTGTTLYMVLLAAYNVLLSKFTGQEDIIVSAPIENRPDIRLDNVVGIFLNTLSFRNNPQKTKPFDTFLEEVKETVVKSFENQDYPFEELVNQLDLQGNLSRIPLFDTLFNLLNVDRLVERQVGSLTFRPFRPRKPAVKFDINIAISEIEERLKVSCQYRTTLFKRRSIQYLMSEYLRLLEFISNDPRKQIKQYAIFNPSDLSEDTRASWAEVKPGMPNDQFSRKEIQQSIAQRFEEQVKRNPGGLAVKTQDTTMTYLELNKAANRIAHVIGAQLSELSGTGQPVALLFGHGAAMVSAVFGVLKSGNPYFPLDSEHPEERLLFMLRDSFTPLMLTDTLNLPLAEHLRQHTGRDIKILNIDTLDANLPDENPSIAVDPGQPAYILYTSGTTGNPKGVLQAHCNVLHFMRNYANNLRIDQTDKLTLFATYTFDAAMMDMFGALLNGAALFPYDLKAEKQLANLSQWLNDEGITVFHSTPTLFRYFVDALSSESQFPSVRLVVLGGEAVTRSAFEDYKTHFPDHCILANNYGPTESTTVYMNILDKEADITGETVPIGFPIDDTDVYLLDENNEETPVYQVGELVYSSRYLALGYVNQPFKTAEVFIANPVTGSGRAYRSGDLGQLLPDGTVRFIGRNDSQIKIRGYRVELKEIELQLSKLENIGNCAVTLVTNEDGENHLAAYYVPSDGIKEAPASNKIQDFLTLHLPSYMVPNYYVPMEEIPLTTTGKIDWKSLPAPDAGLEAQREYIAPSTSTQEQLVTIWQELLKTKKQIGITDNFFQLGGHSLRAMNMTVKIQEAFGVDIALKEIFNHPYINHIAELIDEEVDKLKKFEQILKEIEEMGG